VLGKERTTKTPHPEGEGGSVCLLAEDEEGPSIFIGRRTEASMSLIEFSYRNQRGAGANKVLLGLRVKNSSARGRISINRAVGVAASAGAKNRCPLGTFNGDKRVWRGS